MKLTFASNKLREVILHGAEPTVVLLGIAESNTEKAASSLERSHSSQKDSVLSSDVSGDLFRGETGLRGIVEDIVCVAVIYGEKFDLCNLPLDIVSSLFSESDLFLIFPFRRFKESGYLLAIIAPLYRASRAVFLYRE